MWRHSQFTTSGLAALVPYKHPSLLTWRLNLTSRLHLRHQIHLRHLFGPSFPKHACLVWHGRAMSPEPDSLKHGRVLACALCKKRRVKCSRTFPCTNCVRAGAQCVQPDSRKRRPRFPERQLLDRLRQYEDLLRQNNVEFTPLHSSTAASTAGNDDDGVPSRRVRDSSEAVYVFG